MGRQFRDCKSKFMNSMLNFTHNLKTAEVIKILLELTLRFNFKLLPKNVYSNYSEKRCQEREVYG